MEERGSSGPNQELDIGTWKLGAPEAKGPLNKPHVERRNKVFQAIPSPISAPHHPHRALPPNPCQQRKRLRDGNRDTHTQLPHLSPHSSSISLPFRPCFLISPEGSAPRGQPPHAAHSLRAGTCTMVSRFCRDVETELMTEEGPMVTTLM